MSGKTGTAQVAGKGGYHSGRTEHLVSFCGYYPSDDPQYTCIVSIRTAAPGASGGAMSGTVFKTIAERVYSKNVVTDISRASDSLSIFVPNVKAGETQSTKQVLASLKVPFKKGAGWDANYGKFHHDSVRVSMDAVQNVDTMMPDLLGMGARDAIFAIEKRGMRARVHGFGKVKKQSLAAGSQVKKGQIVVLEMD